MGWLKLSTYMKLVTSVDSLPRKFKTDLDFVFGMEDNWSEHIKASPLAIKTSTIIILDRRK
jgi:hypothetical protein